MFHFAKAIFICFSCDSEASFFPSTYPSEPPLWNALCALFQQGPGPGSQRHFHW
ncbi:hypothetical protein E1A91_D05G349300v1 [Gossypium mustelinum]|uniref:Uncharacterized protein n=1 Tax=Gossypium mustelinum TaxID=34275 RepID=A0A5D2V4M3_GOSMU|nr:hypothetical protein E1A91_D05G349300v1 [Gossypium mustelinum]